MQNYKIYGFTVSSNHPFACLNADKATCLDLEFVYRGLGNSSFDFSRALIVYRSSMLTEGGEPWLSIYRFKNQYIYHTPQMADFYLRPHQIVAQLLDPDYVDSIELDFLGPVISLWMEIKGIPTLHSSSVEVGHHAVAFLSTSRGGKSSLAGAFVQAGYPLITDDVLPIDKNDGIFLGRPGYPQMKMWKEVAVHFLGDCHDLMLVNPVEPLSLKYKVPIGTGRFGTFCNQSRKLSAIYLPERKDKSDSRIIIEPVSPRDALIELIRNSFTARAAEAMGLGVTRMKFFADLAMQIPMHRIIYPTGLKNLTKVRDAILDDLGELSAQREKKPILQIRP